MAIRIAAIQMTSNQDVKHNLVATQKWLEEASRQEAKLIVLPEMFALMGIDQMDKVKAREELGHGPIQDFLSEQAAKLGVWLVAGTIPIAVPESPEKVYASCLLYDDQGKMVSRYDKIHLFDANVPATQEVYLESKAVTAGDKIVVAETPFGKLGLAVCYDIRFPEMFRAMQLKGAEIIALPSAFTYTTGEAHWDVLVRARAIENQVFMIAAGQTGTHTSTRKTYGHSMIVDPWGKVLAHSPKEEGVVITEVNLDYLHDVRQKFPALTHRKIHN